MPFSTNNIQPDFNLGWLYVSDTLSDTGFTSVVASVDTNLVYLADAAHGGSDANDGLTDTTPKLTWTAALPLLRDGLPDHLLMRRGSIFNAFDESNNNMVPFKAGRSSAEPMIIGTYGPVADGRPEVRNFDFNSTGSSVPAQRNLAYHGINVHNTTQDPDSDEFYFIARIRNSDITDVDNIGHEVRLTILGTDNVRTTATHIVQGGDTGTTVMDEIMSQLSVVVGVTMSRENTSTWSIIKFDRALPGIFAPTDDYSAYHGSQRPTEISLYLIQGEGGFSWLSRSDGSNNENIRFEDCIFDDVEIGIQGYSNTQISQNIIFNRCIWPISWTMGTTDYKNSSRGASLFVHNTSGLKILESVTDYGGWHPTYPTAGVNNRSHSFYIQYSVGNDTEFLSNIVLRPASHGIQMRNGGLCQDSFFGRCSIANTLGYDGIALTAGEKAYTFDCVVSEGWTMGRGFEVDIDTDFVGSLVWGITTATDEDIILGDVRIQRNIVSMFADISLDPLRSLYPIVNVGSGTEYDPKVPIFYPSAIRTDNIAYRFDSPDQVLDPNYIDPERTLGSYYLHLVANGDIDELVADGVIPEPTIGDDDFDTMAGILKSRRLLKWDQRLTSEAINSYIRAGFEVN